MESSRFFRTVGKTKTFTADGYSKITQVKILDKNTEGKGASAAIIAGGVGQTFVTIRFESQKGEGIDFVVELYGSYSF